MPAESDRDLFDTIAKLTTEARNPRSTDLDRMDVPAILELINDEDVRVAEAVRGELPHVAAAVELVLEAFRRGGRLLYVGAGTSGRLGVLDAAECPPTFGSDPSLVRGIIAGGEGALVRAVEGAEDDAAAGARAIADAGVGAADVVCGIAASRRTPFVRSAVAAARAAGAKTVYITMNPRSSLDVKVDVAVCPVVGPEVLMGSTRMKAALAQKMVLTMITTAVFVRLGKTYENMMIDLMDTSAKLRERAKRVLMTVTGVEYEGAAAALQAAGGSVKTAIVMVETGVDRSEARRLLDASDGFVRRAIETHRKG